MNANDKPEAAINRRGWKKLLLSLLVWAGTFVLQVVGFLTVILLDLPEEGLTSMILIEALSASGAVLGMAALGGVTWLATSHADMADAFRTTRVILLADVFILGLACVEYLTGNAAVTPDWPINLVGTALVCLEIGIFEECLYRGIVLNGVLAVTGRSHRGTMWGVMLASILFGLGHVDFSTDFADLLLATQAVLKVIQTGLFSLVLCSIVLRTRRLGGAALVHGLSDFLLLVPSLVLAGEELSTEYVSTGEDGVVGIVLYITVIVIYLPIAIKALRRMSRERITYRGVFMEGVIPSDADGQEMVDDGPQRRDRSGFPVPPNGFR